MRRQDTRTDTPPSAPMGLLSGLEAQDEIKKLLDELYGDGRRDAGNSSVADPAAPVYGAIGTSLNTPSTHSSGG